MERKSIKSKSLEQHAIEATSDEEQKLWEEKKLGVDKKYAGRSDLYKTPAKLISIRIPEEILVELKSIADHEGIKYQTYIVGLLTKHVKRKRTVA